MRGRSEVNLGRIKAGCHKKSVGLSGSKVGNDSHL